MKKLTIVLVCVSILICGYWFSLKNIVHSSISGVISSAREKGHNLQFKEAYVGASPFLMEWEIKNVSLNTKKDGGNSWVARVPEIRISLNPLNPLAIRASTSGNFQVTRISNGRESYYSGDIKRFQSEASIDLFDKNIKIAMAEVEVSDVEIRGNDVLPITNKIEQVEFVIDSKNKMSNLHPIRKARASFDGTSPLYIDEIVIAHGPVLLRGNGTLYIGKNNDPEIYLNSEITGLYDAAELAEKRGYYNSLNATEAENVLKVFCSKAKDHYGPIFNIELSLREQAIYAGEMKMFEISHKTKI